MPNPSKNQQNSANNPESLSPAVAEWLAQSSVDDESVASWLRVGAGAGQGSGYDFSRACILAGSFNPFHDGHRRMLSVGRERSGRECFCEISIDNVDKQSMDASALAGRIHQDFSPAGLILSRLPNFADKAKAFSGALFLAGADTIIRINDLKYYGNDQSTFDSRVASIAETNSRFLVFGRMDGNTFVDPQNIVLRAGLREICDFVSREEFEVNVSSTELRESNRQAAIKKRLTSESDGNEPRQN